MTPHLPSILSCLTYLYWMLVLHKPTHGHYNNPSDDNNSKGQELGCCEQVLDSSRPSYRHYVDPRQDC